MTSDGALVFRAGGKFRVGNQLPLYIAASLQSPATSGRWSPLLRPLAHDAPAAERRAVFVEGNAVSSSPAHPPGSSAWS
jgi:hypothetical protein